MLKSMINKIKKNHFVLMVLCCAVPLFVFFVLSSLGAEGSWGYYALFLLCPLAHIFMMRGMKSCSREQHNVEKPKQIEFK